MKILFQASSRSWLAPGTLTLHETSFALQKRNLIKNFKLLTETYNYITTWFKKRKYTKFATHWHRKIVENTEKLNYKFAIPAKNFTALTQVQLNNDKFTMEIDCCGELATTLTHPIFSIGNQMMQQMVPKYIKQFHKAEVRPLTKTTFDTLTTQQKRTWKKDVPNNKVGVNN